VAHDDINLVLTGSKGEKEAIDVISGIVKKAEGNFSVYVIKRRPEIIKKGSRFAKTFDFVYLNRNKTGEQITTFYSKYVLNKGVGIGAGKMSAGASERLAKKLAKGIGKDAREELLKKGTLKYMPSKSSP